MQRSALVTLYKNHGTSPGFWRGWAEATDDGAKVVIEHARTLEGKISRHEYAAKAKNVGRSNETSPFEQAQLELDSRSRKQLDKGYVERLEDAASPSTNTLGLAKPMLATPFEKVKPESIDWDTAHCQPKLDGHRALAKDGMLYSRQGKTLDLPHIVEAIKASGAEHLHLDGELYLHGKTLQEISSLVKRHQDDTTLIEYHVYDCVAPAAFAQRQQMLKEALTGSVVPNGIKRVPTLQAKDAEALQELHTQHLACGYEGTMLRFGDGHYQDGKRSRSLLKLKNFQDAEFEIVGVERGKPLFTGKGSFERPVWVLDDGSGKTFTATAQGNMHERDALWQTRQDHIGKQLTVKFHYLSAEGTPILPVALRFREDV